MKQDVKVKVGMTPGSQPGESSMSQFPKEGWQWFNGMVKEVHEKQMAALQEFSLELTEAQKASANYEDLRAMAEAVNECVQSFALLQTLRRYSQKSECLRKLAPQLKQIAIELELPF